MHDIRAIRENPELYEQQWAAKGSAGRVAEILELDGRLRGAQTSLQAAQAERNEASKKIGQAKARKDEAEATRLMAHVESLKKTLEQETEVERQVGDLLRQMLAALPNLPAPDVPPGQDETENRELRRWGEPRAIAGAKDHVDL